MYYLHKLPIISYLPIQEARERVLYANFLRVNQDIKDMIKEIQQYIVKK